ncbi:hypothetical protein KY290_008968 [Solanum tuberosum]|uniref:Uncharacterized protein n=1 Tax=Solanum tuberosum TaxID=4113 RepID=A0ABQ7WCK8_SOLTU|nr:hypothetical protein KY290_008968 [Solanum tuberosum]
MVWVMTKGHRDRQNRPHHWRVIIKRVYYEDGVSKRIIAYDKPFTEAEAHFADAKFYFKKYAIKVDEITSGDSELLNKKAKAKEDEGHSLKLRGNALEGLTLPIKQIDMIKSSKKILGKSMAPKSLFYRKFMAFKSSQYEALPMKRIEEDFDPNAYRLLAKAGFNPNVPSKLGKLPLELVMTQQREGFSYK